MNWRQSFTFQNWKVFWRNGNNVKGRVGSHGNQDKERRLATQMLRWAKICPDIITCLRHMSFHVAAFSTFRFHSGHICALCLLDCLVFRWLCVASLVCRLSPIQGTGHCLFVIEALKSINRAELCQSGQSGQSSQIARVWSNNAPWCCF